MQGSVSVEMHDFPTGNKKMLWKKKSAENLLDGHPRLHVAAEMAEKKKYFYFYI